MKGKKTGGRQANTPNKATADVREAIAAFASANAGHMEGWLKRVQEKDPAKAIELYLRAIEYHIPKLAATQHSGKVETESRLIIKK